MARLNYADYYNVEFNSLTFIEGSEISKTQGGQKRMFAGFKCSAYKYYGAKGITVCESWLTFENFYNDMHSDYSKGLEIERIDGSRDYEFGNCKWATDTEQVRNRSNTLMLMYQGITKPVATWCEDILFKAPRSGKHITK